MMVDQSPTTRHDVGMPRKVPLSDQLRAAVENSGLTRYRICQETGIDKGSMSRFMSGAAGLSFESLDRLADLLDLRISTSPKRRKGA
jgi:transcriptional regulator with XRE-family HTH domain